MLSIGVTPIASNLGAIVDLAQRVVQRLRSLLELAHRLECLSALLALLALRELTGASQAKARTQIGDVDPRALRSRRAPRFEF